jgi:hypothetical protein
VCIRFISEKFHSLRICHQINTPGTEAAIATAVGSTIFAFEVVHGIVCFDVDVVEKKKKKKKKIKTFCNKRKKLRMQRIQHKTKHKQNKKQFKNNILPSALDPNSGHHVRRASAQYDASQHEQKFLTKLTNNQKIENNSFFFFSYFNIGIVPFIVDLLCFSEGQCQSSNCQE